MLWAVKPKGGDIRSRLNAPNLKFYITGVDKPLLSLSLFPSLKQKNKTKPTRIPRAHPDWLHDIVHVYIFKFVLLWFVHTFSNMQHLTSLLVIRKWEETCGSSRYGLTGVFHSMTHPEIRK